MRRLVVLSVLLALMLGVRALQDGSSVAADPLILAAIGFVLLAAFTVAGLGSVLRLPKVTGYILAGVALGPSAADILSREVVDEMRMFNTLALGLIATGAGLELDVRQLCGVLRTLTATIAVKVVAGLVLVGGTLVAVQSFAHLLPLESSSHVLALAIVMGALSIGTSPAIVLAVLTETRARGRLSDLVLGAAVLKDLVVVVVLAMAVAIARTLVTPGTAMDGAMIVTVTGELAGSIAVGAVLGALLIAYIRYVRAEMLLFVAAMILVVSELGRALHLELLLVFITAGFVVRNFSSYERVLHGPLALVSLPVFVVFFTNAGASVDLRTTWAILPLALALCAARALAYFLAARAGAAAGAEAAPIRAHAWLAYLPQAGVTLGLVGLAASQLPELGSVISTTGMAVVAINLLLGPMTLRGALRAAGETAAQEEAKPHKRRKDHADAEQLPPPKPSVDFDVAAQTLIDGVGNPHLQAHLRNTYENALEVVRAFRREQLEDWCTTMQRELDEALGQDLPVASNARLRDWLKQQRVPVVMGYGEKCEQLLQRARELVEHLPAWIEVPLEPEQCQPQPGDSRTVRACKRLTALRSKLWNGRGPVRRVPVQLAARVCLDPAFSSLAAGALGSWCRVEATVCEELRLYTAASTTAGDTRERIKLWLGEWPGRFEHDARISLATGFEEFARMLSLADGPSLSVSQIRYSKVESRVREAGRALADDPRVWGVKLQAAQAAPMLAAELALLESTARAALSRSVLADADAAKQEALPIAESVRDLVARLRTTSAFDEAALRKAATLCHNTYSVSVERQLELIASRLRPAAAIHEVAVQMRALIQSLPERVTLARADTPAHLAADPRQVASRTINPRELATQQLMRELLPAIDGRLHELAAIFAGATARIRECVDMLLHAIESRIDLGDELGDETMAKVLARAQERLDTLVTDLQRGPDELRAVVETSTRESLAALRELASLSTATSTPLVRVDGVLSSVRQRVREKLRPAQGAIRQAYRRLDVLGRRLGGGHLPREMRQRYETGDLDATTIWCQAQSWRSAGAVPESYARLFSVEPVREPRLFTAYRAELAQLMAAERQWLHGGPSSVLLVGQHGSGRTSMLNMCEIEMSSPRVIRPERGASRDRALLTSLAYQLQTRPHERAVLAELRRVRTTVLLDDMEHWFTPDAAGLRQLERFLDMVQHTSADVFWVVSSTTEALRVLEDAFPVRQSFGTVVTLHPLRLEALVQVVEARHQLSGLRIAYPDTVASRLLGRFDRTSDRMIFFRLLANYSEGNLARTHAAWLRSVELGDDDTVRPAVRQVLGLRMPFVRHLAAREIAILIQVLRFGPLSLEALSSTIGVSPNETDRHVRFLQNAGLLEHADATRDELRVPTALQAPLVQGLRSEGAWP